MIKPIILFTNHWDNIIGGMEVHQQAFINFFEKTNTNFYIAVLANKIRIYKNNQQTNEFSSLDIFINFLNKNFDEAIFFFNNLSWVKEIPIFRHSVRTRAKYIIRSGGNDIFRAPYENDEISLYERQRIIVNIINKYVDILIVNSNYSYKRNIRININQNIMKKIRGGVDCNLTQKLLSQRIKNQILFKNQFNIFNKKILSIVSRFVDFKGIIEFLDYYSKIDYRQYFLLLVGDGKLFQTIYNKMKRNFSNNYYAFTGAVNHDEAMKYISISDILINPSIEVKRFFKNEYYIHTETMGRTMLEAICLRIPILAMNSGGTKEIFEESHNVGICTNSWNNLNDTLYRAGEINSVTQMDYSWEKVFSEYLKLFE